MPDCGLLLLLCYSWKVLYIFLYKCSHYSSHSHQTCVGLILTAGVCLKLSHLLPFEMLCSITSSGDLIGHKDTGPSGDLSC